MSMLVDSVIFIDHFNSIPEATQFIEQHCDDIHLSVVTRAEILVGFEKTALKNAKDLLNIFPTIDFTKDDADLAAALRRQHKWRLPDAIQAAIAKQNNLTLVTRNTKDFNPNKHKFVQVPYSLGTS